MVQNRLRELRKKQRLASAGLAVRSGVSTATISWIENHNFYPKPSTRVKIANALGVAESEIFQPEKAA